MLLGEPAEVVAYAKVGPSGVDEVLAAAPRWRDGRLAVVDCGLALSRRQEYEVVGTSGHLRVPQAFVPRTGTTTIDLVRNLETSTLTVPGADQYQRMVEHFADVVRSRVPLRLPPEDAVANLRVIEAALRSARTGNAERVV
jgi:predicted dehydrogenase